MAFLARAICAASLLAGCYSPDLRDCTVSCASSADCAGAQVCNASHMCAAKDVACSNTTSPPPLDAASDGPTDGAHDAARSPPIDAARTVDAAAPPIDAPAPVTLHLRVDGGGGELDVGTMTCSDDCTYQVAYGVPLVIVARAMGNHAFAGWTQGPCNGQRTATCAVTPTAPTNVTGRFVHGGDNGGGGD